LTLYTDQYGLFGDPEVLPLKVLWDYTYYWSVMAPMFFQARLTDMASLSQLRGELATCQRLNAAVQRFLRAWGEHSHKRNPPQMLDQAALPWFAELNRALTDPLDDEAWRESLRAAARRLRMVATELLQRGCDEHPALEGSELHAELLASGGLLNSPEPLLFAALDETAPA
ncbi:MAG TPA: halogenase, partial [Rubrivivax sp.]|nr:halogenase [Rubrivivax sp.]